MKKEHYITAAEFCSGHNIEVTFLHSLDENGLIHFQRSDEILYIKEDQLPELEKIVTFYFDLGINLEGIETIINLLEHTKELKEEIDNLKNRLRFYENI